MNPEDEMAERLHEVSVSELREAAEAINDASWVPFEAGDVDLANELFDIGQQIKEAASFIEDLRNDGLGRATDRHWDRRDEQKADA